MTADAAARIRAYLDPSRRPGDVRLRVPEDVDELLAAVALLRSDCEAMGGSTWLAGPVARATDWACRDTSR